MSTPADISDIPSDLATIKTEETTHLNTLIDVPDTNLRQTRHLPNRNNALIELILFCTTNAGWLSIIILIIYTLHILCEVLDFENRTPIDYIINISELIE